MPSSASFRSTVRWGSLWIFTLGITACGDSSVGPGVSGGALGRIYAGNGFTCGIVEGGRGLCWGINDEGQLVLCSQSLFRFADLGDDGLCRGGPDKGCGVIVSAIDVVVDRLD